MNVQLIEELEDRASQYASKQTTDLDEWEFIFRKKFAELIVAECKSVLLDVMEEDHSDSLALDVSLSEINERFGLEDV